MERRSFIHQAAMAAGFGVMPGVATNVSDPQTEKNGKMEYYELRTYRLSNAAQEKLVLDYFQQAAIPALNKLGVTKVGVFKEMKSDDQPDITVLLTFRSPDDYLRLDEKLMKDSNYMKAASAYLDAPSSAPAYDRMESSLFRAFKGMPKLLAPENKPRMFELRRYESSGEAAGKKKIEMFNDAGEIEIFKRTGLTPVFFGECLVGPNRPNLTYMLSFDDMADHDRSWKQFIQDPEWKKISAIPEYADAKIVSKISSVFLVPVDFSQI